MNIANAKSIPIDELLLKAGYQPAKERGGRKWYIRPYGNENTASFVLSKDGHAWFDHGTGKGGNIIDLAMILGDCTEVSDALSYIESVTGPMSHALPIIPQRLPVEPELPAYVIEATRTMADRRGENWLRSRALDVEACRLWLSDIYFNRALKPLAKPMYGVGLPNIAGGVDMRTQLTGGPWIKSSIAPKTISVLPSRSAEVPWYVFEGLPDFMTFLTIARPEVDKYSFLVLNGVGMTGHAINFFKKQKDLFKETEGRINLCPQHGSQGSLASCETLRGFIADQGWTGGDIDYPKEFYDLNAWYMDKKGIKPMSAKPVTGPTLKTTPKFNL